jgi:hypothetical protein
MIRAKDDVVVEELSSLVAAANNRTQEDSASGYRWLQPLDEQIQYYLHLVKDASPSLSDRTREPRRESRPTRVEH